MICDLYLFIFTLLTVCYKKDSTNTWLGLITRYRGQERWHRTSAGPVPAPPLLWAEGHCGPGQEVCHGAVHPPGAYEADTRTPAAGKEDDKIFFTYLNVKISVIITCSLSSVFLVPVIRLSVVSFFLLVLLLMCLLPVWCQDIDSFSEAVIWNKLVTFSYCLFLIISYW